MTSEAEFDIRYENLYGRIAGFLPIDRSAVTDFNWQIKQQVAERGRPDRFRESVEKFRGLLDDDGVVRMLVYDMIKQVPDKHRTVDDIPELLAHLDHITEWAPFWVTDKKKRNFFPMSALFTYMMMTDAGEAVFRNRRLNAALRLILRDWCHYLDSKASRHVLTKRPNGWFSPPAAKYNELDQFIIPEPDAKYGGFASFNAFFHRQIKAKARPIAHKRDEEVVISPNDGKIYKVARDIAWETMFWIKGQPYSVRDMLLGGRSYSEEQLEIIRKFEGGDVFQSYLSGADYHRWHSPVKGRVLWTEIVEGLMFSNLPSEGNDIKGMGSQGYYSAVNTRGMCFIKAHHEPLGVVCVMPIGITEISSIRHTVGHDDEVEKGGELGRFSYGGSTLAVLFQRGAINHFTAFQPDNPKIEGTVKVNSELAIAN